MNLIEIVLPQQIPVLNHALMFAISQIVLGWQYNNTTNISEQNIGLTER